MWWGKDLRRHGKVYIYLYSWRCVCHLSLKFAMQGLLWLTGCCQVQHPECLFLSFAPPPLQSPICVATLGWTVFSRVRLCWDQASAMDSTCSIATNPSEDWNECTMHPPLLGRGAHPCGCIALVCQDLPWMPAGYKWWWKCWQKCWPWHIKH